MRKYLQPAWYVGHHVDLDASIHRALLLSNIIAQASRAREAHGVDAVDVDPTLRDERLDRFRPGFA